MFDPSKTPFNYATLYTGNGYVLGHNYIYLSRKSMFYELRNISLQILKWKSVISDTKIILCVINKGNFYDIFLLIICCENSDFNVNNPLCCTPSRQPSLPCVVFNSYLLY